MREELKPIARDILRLACGANRSQWHEELVIKLSRKHDVSRNTVRLLIGRMVDQKWIELHRGRRLNSKLWIRPTPEGRKAWLIVRQRLRTTRSAP